MSYVLGVSLEQAKYSEQLVGVSLGSSIFCDFLGNLGKHSIRSVRYSFRFDRYCVCGWWWTALNCDAPRGVAGQRRGSFSRMLHNRRSTGCEEATNRTSQWLALKIIGPRNPVWPYPNVGLTTPKFSKFASQNLKILLGFKFWEMYYPIQPSGWRHQNFQNLHRKFENFVGIKILGEISLTAGSQSFLKPVIARSDYIPKWFLDGTQ